MAHLQLAYSIGVVFDNVSLTVQKIVCVCVYSGYSLHDHALSEVVLQAVCRVHKIFPFGTYCPEIVAQNCSLNLY